MPAKHILRSELRAYNNQIASPPDGLAMPGASGLSPGGEREELSVYPPEAKGRASHEDASLSSSSNLSPQPPLTIPTETRCR